MAAKRIAINWAAIAERVPADQKPAYLAFKAKSDSYLRKVVSLPEHPPKIDWAFYKSKVPSSAMVDEFQKKYEAIKIPLPADDVSADIAAQEKELSTKVEQFKQTSVARIHSLQEELKQRESQIPITEMTMEDFAYYYPDIALDPVNRPTFWPHTPESQVPDDSKIGGHH